MLTSSLALTGYQLSGLIERVTFFSEESGFCVLRVKAEGHRDLVTVVGSAPSVSAGGWMTAEGGWGFAERHGGQSRAFRPKTWPRTPHEGVKTYQATGPSTGSAPASAT